MATIVFFGIILFSVWLALRRAGASKGKSAHDYFVASRQFGGLLVFFLTAGEIYSIGTMIGFPGGIYAKGPTYGIWFLGYILLAYPIMYFMGPHIWRAGKKYDAVTMPDLLKGHFQNRFLEVVAAVTAILFLVPWGQLQFTGLIVALHGLGWTFPPSVLVAIAAALAFLYIAISGVRSTAAIAVLKDVIMVAAIIVTGVAVLWHFDVRQVFDAANAHVRNTMNPTELRFSISTILFQSLGFVCVPMLTQFLFTAKSDQTIRRAQIPMPLYMFMYPFLVLASYYAISANLQLASPNDAFIAAAVRLLPGWLLGVVAAGAALSGLLVLAGLCLAIGPLVCRNLMPHTPESQQKKVSRVVVVIFLLASMALTLLTPNLMLVLINTAYFGFTQFFPSIFAVLFLRNVNPVALAIGMLVGQGAAIYADYAGLAFGGVNIGLVCLCLNVLIVFVGSLLFKPRLGTLPIYRHVIE